MSLADIKAMPVGNVAARDAVYDPTANGINTYALACQLARGGHEGVLTWFKSDLRSGDSDAVS